MNKKFFVTTCLLIIVSSAIIFFLSNFLNLTFLFNIHKSIQHDIFKVVRSAKLSEDIIMVDAGNLNRKETSELLDSINSSGPKVVALDFCYNKKNTTEYDSLLFSSMSQIENLVLYSKKGKNCCFTPNSICAESSLLTDDDHYCHSFASDSLDRFEFIISELYNPGAIKEIKTRHHEEELIWFYGSTFCFSQLDHTAILGGPSNYDKTIFKDKIVLIGYLKGDNYILSTPATNNENVNGTYDQMPITYVMANVIQTILNNDYIDKVSGWKAYFIEVIIVILLLMPAYYILRKSIIAYIIYCFVISGVVLTGTSFAVAMIMDSHKILFCLDDFGIILFISEIIFLILFLSNKKQIVKT